ncbi:MAG: SDR family oxidoreductase [Chlamydiae bacterium]|nr:SDR family oxidoreductase [Chlamydiota bacterium]MBI3276230.1 SDR family oxidoreductase [Chlamydiota bacterium]
MQNSLQGLTALVTGGTRGIGRAIVDELCSAGVSVFFTGRKLNVDVPSGCTYRAVDFSDDISFQNFEKEISKLTIDILVNNAGMNRISSFEKIDRTDFNQIQSVNLHAPFLLCRAVIPYMRKKKWGRIVNMSSIFGIVSKEFRASYSASKFALDGMTAALAAEVAQEGILANCVSPGFIDTELTRSVLDEGEMRDIVSRVPMKRLGKPEEVAKLVAWLVSRENTYISGQNIVIDGGFTRV